MTTQPPDDHDKPQEERHEASFTQAAASAAAAMFGVQSSKNREKDFKARSPGRFIFMGMIMVMLFVTCVLFAVRCSMQQSGVLN